MTTQKPHGLWPSPLTPAAMAGALRLDDLAWADDGDTLVWLEGRDSTGVLVARSGDDAARDLTTSEVDVRGGVGYGGGAFAVHGKTVFFCERQGRHHRLELEAGRPRPLTPPFGKAASPTVSPDGEWVVYVHTHEVTDVLGAVDAEGRRWPIKLVSGADFYMQPTWHPDGDRLAWIAWDHPQMPWDGARLETAEIMRDDDGLRLGEIEVWEGDPSYAVQQPKFSPDGDYIAYLSDESGWWRLIIRDLETGDTLTLSEADGDIGGPAWIQGLRFYDWAPNGKSLIAVRNHEGESTLLRFHVDGSVTVAGDRTYRSMSQPAISKHGRLAMIGSSSRIPSRILNLKSGEELRVLKRSRAERVPREHLAEVESVSWEHELGDERVEVHGNFYPPTNPAFAGSDAPPAIVMIHGGPTSQRTAGFEPRNQFFATRGFAVLDVNYRGSTGYGRAYMESLYGNWGVYDVEDAVSAVQFLGDEGHADPERVVIMGGSAGGYTVLQSLVTHPGTFAAGVSMYGISNLFSLAMETHKFEASYNDLLVGPLPEAAEAFRERSPIFHADQISDPLAVYQGAKDRVVPKNQADEIVATLERNDVPHVYHVYEEEGHGWRRTETIEHFYETVLDFLKRHVLFT
jgi:dipeptidyl aminopeptidase/acylaminoacyl peptidase